MREHESIIAQNEAGQKKARWIPPELSRLQAGAAELAAGMVDDGVDNS